MHLGFWCKLADIANGFGDDLLPQSKGALTDQFAQNMGCHRSLFHVLSAGSELRRNKNTLHISHTRVKAQVPPNPQGVAAAARHEK